MCAILLILDNSELQDGEDVGDLSHDNIETEISEILANNDLHQQSQNYIEELKRALRKVGKKCSMYKRKYEQKEERLAQVFNHDQLQFLKTGSHRGTKWSEETVTKAIKLYLACGEKGYTELREQNLPYPSIRTIQHRLHNLKFEEGILQDIFNLMKLKVRIRTPLLTYLITFLVNMALSQ
jgi:hypothetical protein